MKKASVIKAFYKVEAQIAFEVMLNRFQSGYYAKEIMLVRQLLADGEMEAYKKAKSELDGITFSAQYEGGRGEKFRIAYNGILVMDFDNLADAELHRVRGLIIQCPYTLACFISPSGNGLKVLINVSTDADEHRNAFLSLQSFYETLTGVKIDPSGKDISRLCFVSYDKDLYYNPGATVYVPNSVEGHVWPVVKPKAPVLAGAASQSTMETYRRCIAELERRSNYVEGSRNTFVFELALLMSRAGMTKSFTTLMLLQDYNFDALEVRTCIKSAYGYKVTGTETEIHPKPEAPPPLKKRQPKPESPFADGNDLAYETGILPAASDLKAPSSPDDSPKEEPKKVRQQLYKLKTVEKLLSKWIETRYNVVLGTVEWRPLNSEQDFKRIKDHDENTWFRWLHNEDQMIPINTLHVLLNSDYSRSVNPFTEYFKHLPKWDGVTDYIDMISDTVKTEDDVTWKKNFRKWFVAYATSLVVDEVINHTVIVFVGAQGVGKTSWMKLLAPKQFKDYVGTAVIQSDSKDMAIMLSECILIYLDDMEGLNRKDLAAFKELITRSDIHIRRPYGRNTESLIRHASFGSSVNHDQMLTDPTGSRRYLCSKVISIDYKHPLNIDGAMAQARALYQSGFQYWFDKDEIKELTDQNEVFMSKTVEEELIDTWVRPVTLQEWDDRHKYANSQNTKRLTATQIAGILMEKTRILLVDSTIVKIGKILHKKGYVRVKLKSNYYYLVRIIEADVVEMNTHTLGDEAAQKVEQDTNDQYIRFEEDLFNSIEDDGLPF